MVNAGKQIQTAIKAVNTNLANLTSTASRNFSIPRPRSLGEFIIYPGRWRLPDLKNMSNLFRRVKTNLLYFQTNYLIATLMLFAFMMIMSMKTLLTGIVSAIVIILAILFFFEHIPQARQIKQNHPTLVICVGIILVIVTWQALHTILLVIGAILAPIPLWFLHASMRSTEGLVDGSQFGGDYFVNTPLGQIMQMVGIEPRAG